MAQNNNQPNVTVVKGKLIDKTLTLRAEQGIMDKDGEKIEYITYFAELNGIKVKVIPNDQTAKQLLAQYYKGE
jgi:hypothetical protein